MGIKIFFLIIFFAVIAVLVCFSTWLQGKVVHLITMHAPQYAGIAPTLAALLAGLVQFAIVFPLEKFVLLKERKEQ